MSTQHPIKMSVADYQALYFTRRHHPTYDLNWYIHDTPDEDSEYFELAVLFSTSHDTDEEGFLGFRIDTYNDNSFDFEVQVKLDKQNNQLLWQVADLRTKKRTLLEKHAERKEIQARLNKAFPQVFKESVQFMNDFKKAALSAESETLTSWLASYNETKPIDTWARIEKKGVMRSVYIELSPWITYDHHDNPINEILWLAAESRKPQLSLKVRIINIKEPYPIDLQFDIIPFFKKHLVLKQNKKGGPSEVFPLEEWLFVNLAITSAMGAAASRQLRFHLFKNDPPLTSSAFFLLIQAMGQDTYDFTQSDNPPLLKSIKNLNRSHGHVTIAWDGDLLPKNWFIEDEDPKLMINFFFNKKNEFIVDGCTINAEDIIEFINATIQQICYSFDVDPKDTSDSGSSEVHRANTLAIINAHIENVDKLYSLLCPKKVPRLAGSTKISEIVDEAVSSGAIAPGSADDFDLFWVHDGFQSLSTVLWDKDSDIDHLVMIKEMQKVLTDWKVKFEPKQLTQIFTEDSVTYEGFQDSVRQAANEFNLVALDVSTGEELLVAFFPSSRTEEISELLILSKAPFRFIE